jgi:hypothetical protein
MKKALIWSDDIYLKCINLATNSKGDERYGSIIMNNGILIGEGYNRAIAHLSFGKLEREIRQGMANHAEIESMNNALMKGFEISGSEIFVAGYFPKSEQIFFQEEYTCTRCIPYMARYGIAKICIPTPNGWLKKSLEEALEEAKKFSNGTHQKRLDATIGKFYLSELK